MINNRVMKYCPRCKHPWLLEKIKSDWQGSKKSLSDYEVEIGRKNNYCYCGVNLYTGEVMKSAKKIKRANISRN